MIADQLLIRLADFAEPRDQTHFLDLLDHYSRDPFGGGQPLADSVREVLVDRWSQHPGAFTLLAFHGEKLVGLANCLTSFSTFNALPRINIHDLVVVTDARGLGVGRQLIEAVCNESRRRHACQVSLEVRADNHRARELYVRCGFQGIDLPLRDEGHLFGVRKL